METSSRPLTKRHRAPIACNACRLTKSRCDGNSPACERCERLNIECGYSQNARDKRLSRQAERKANFELRSRVSELEARLATTSQTNDGIAAPVNASDTCATVSESGFSAGIRNADNASVASNSDSPIDVLAAGVFDHPSTGSSICYFGSSSNHALFWSLTASIANLGHHSSRLYQEPLQSIRANTGPTRLPRPPSSTAAHSWTGNSHDADAIPQRDVAIDWISRFFETVGAVLPYISEPALLEGFDKIEANAAVLDQPSFRSIQALLSIVFAHSLSTLDDPSAELYYRQTLGLLAPKTLYTPSLELPVVQALLLLSIFQQNNQRSTESWTTHSLAVKTSYQLGIHAPSAYEHLRASEKELRSRLWFAVINQDRMLSSGLGQPCLIPSQHVRKGILDMLVSRGQQRTIEMQYPKENISYYRNLICLHDIMGTAVDSICCSNIDPSSCLAMEDLVKKTFDLSLQLGRWRDDAAPMSVLNSDTDPGMWSSDFLKSQRNNILISLFYYRTALLVHGPLLMRILEVATHGPQGISSRVLQDSIGSLLKDDFTAITELSYMIRSILDHDSSFFKRNAVWWTCNYAALTLSLHLFGFWIASNITTVQFIAFGQTNSQLEAQLRGCLNTLQRIGSSSAMSVKAHRCLQRHLDFLTRSFTSSENRVNEHSDSDVPAADPQGTQHQARNSLHHVSNTVLLADPTATLFGDLTVPDFVSEDLLGLGLGITDFDATGLL